MTMKSAMATSFLLGTLVLAGLAVGHGELDTNNNIRLPSDGKTDKPWDCCNNIEMSPVEVFPPLYRCNDEVKQCAANCKECVEAPGDFPRGAFVCRDWYQTADEDPGPKCTAPENKRPWGKCCDNIEKSPLAIFPPFYHCNDEVKQCAAACKECVEAPGPFPRGAFVCNDWYQTTDPGPRCTAPDKKRPWKCCDDLVKSPAKIFPPLWHCNDKVTKCAAACKKCVEEPGDVPAFVCNDSYWGVNPGPVCKERPWGKCCDNTRCTKSIPPICTCTDEVNKCAATCKECERVESSDPPRYVCKDQYKGQPGRKCTFNKRN